MSVLFDTNPLVVNPTLAKMIGLNESIVLQQIHYWLEINKKADKNRRDGNYWTYNSYTEWQEQFPFWHVNTIRNLIIKLEGIGLLISGNYNKLNLDRTKWYTINYDNLEELKKNPQTLRQSRLHKSCMTNIQDLYDQNTNLVSPIPETTTENIKQRLTRNKGIAKRNSHRSWKQLDLTASEYEVINFYMECYKRKTRKEHPALRLDQWETIRESLFYCSDGDFDKAFDLTEENLFAMIAQHFKTKYQNCDWNILHFCNYEVKVRRMYEVAY